MTEVWKDIPDYPGYELSDMGRVRCSRAIGYSKPPTEPRLVKPKGIGTKRYLAVVLGYKGPTREIHRLVGELFVGGRAPGLEVAHENGNRHDNRAENLRWKTRTENHADKRRHGTSGFKITIEVARQIRDKYSEGGLTQKEVGQMFGITQATVSKIVRDALWAEAA